MKMMICNGKGEFLLGVGNKNFCSLQKAEK